jgi:hypothetical protein
MENVLQYFMGVVMFVAFAGAGFWWIKSRSGGTSDVMPPQPRPIDPDVAPILETKKSSKKKKNSTKKKGGKRK